MLRLTALPKFGVGINYHWEFYDLIQKNLGTIDYIEVSPDILCEEVISDSADHPSESGRINRGFCLDKTKLGAVLALGKQRPIVVHGLGLSIGSASGWNQEYLTLLNQFALNQRFIWHSEHLGFTTVENADGTHEHAGLLLPMPFTHEALDVLCPRIEHLCARYSAPFLIENTTYYLPTNSRTAEQWDEVDFLNQLLDRTHCGLLLDLYNFYCNAVNFGFDPYAALERLQLDRVIEIHVAGGVTHEGFLLDVHSDEVPEPVWELLEWILPKLSNLCAITYEALEQTLPLIGEEKIIAQLKRCKTLWNQHLELNDQGLVKSRSNVMKECEHALA